jgi:Ca2+-binding RTX toxin-like protein
MRKIIKNRLAKLIILSLIVAGLFIQTGIVKGLLKGTATAYNNGDLTIDWGVPSGDPIFTVINILPGDTEQRTVKVTNNALNSLQLAVVGIETSPRGIFPGVLNIVISENGNILYGPKKLSQFFLDSKGPEGIPLSTIESGKSTNYTFTVTFDINANNKYQGLKVVFDLKIGVNIQIPEECKRIKFTGIPILGTEKNDVINGTNGNDLIFGFGGDDIINASNGDDCIVGGSGNDKIYASNGNDVIFGNEGDDWIDGSNGNDLIFGNEGNDVIRDSNGYDIIDAGAGNDDIFDANGDNIIIAGDGDDKIETSNGNNVIRCGPGNDIVNCHNGNDRIYGEEGNDTLSGGNGNDYIEGGPGNDNLTGSIGNDTLLGGPGMDLATGDLGIDRCEAETKKTCEL